MDKISAIVSKERKGPFGSSHTLSLIDTKDKNLEELGKMTSYGVIKGASLYFGGYSAPDDESIIDYGYCFQEALLELTALKLGTCWLGGTFGRGFFAKALSLPEERVIPAISPIGFSLDKRVFADKLVRFLAKSSKRKSPDQLFFSHSTAERLTSFNTDKAGDQLITVLNALRSAPSASNKQPWRLIIGNGFMHLYWDFDTKYNGAMKSFNIQALDMGIALFHIIKSAEEVKLNKSLTFSDPLLNNVPWKYVAGLKLS